jgi:hypothetical protein
MSSSSNGTTQKDIPNAEAHAELYHAGIEMRHHKNLNILHSQAQTSECPQGDEYVDNQLKKVTGLSLRALGRTNHACCIGGFRVFATDAASPRFLANHTSDTYAPSILRKARIRGDKANKCALLI